VDYATIELPITEARLDWLTATCSPLRDFRPLLVYGAELMDRMVDARERKTTWRWYGYDGWQAGSLRFGFGSQGAAIVLSGELANDHARPVAELTTHWSRVDYCATVLDGASQIRPDEDYWYQWSTPTHQRGKPTEYSRVQNSRGGSTFYIGRRASEHFTRVYNKTVESDYQYPKTSWRYELELKGRASDAVRENLDKARLTPQYSAAIIAHELSRHGLAVPYRRDPEVQRDQTPRPTRDADRVLEWLRSQVRASVRFATEARGADAVREALDLANDPILNRMEPAYQHSTVEKAD